ncbi:MAG: type II toxin-antitoxin system RelE/ParE family toxin [Rubrivivax sp.]|nr:type II toxin-antitoxin system RelE/ParE family toxin [Rubrivivax sp.]
MLRIEFAAKVSADFDRIAEHLSAHEASDVAARVESIISAIDLLALHPEIGRPVDDGLRELVIGRGSRSYVALYSYAEEIEVVFALALRSQREAGATP